LRDSFFVKSRNTHGYKNLSEVNFAPTRRIGIEVGLLLAEVRAEIAAQKLVEVQHAIFGR
jgi:hypothetical protein